MPLADGCDAFAIATFYRAAAARTLRFAENDELLGAACFRLHPPQIANWFVAT